MADIRVNRRRAALPTWLWVVLVLVLAAAVWAAFVVIGEAPGGDSGAEEAAPAVPALLQSLVLL